MFPKSLPECLLIGAILSMLVLVSSTLTMHPKIELSFPDVGDYDFKNETFAVMSNSNPGFLMTCTAPYPVEWIFHYDSDDDGTSEWRKFVETRRFVTKFTDLSTYTYVTKVRLDYKGKLLSLVNYTCQEVKQTSSYQPSLATHVIMSEQNHKSILTLRISQENLPMQQQPEQVNQNCSRAIAVMSMDSDDIVPCWDCENAIKSERKLELDFEKCLSASQCNSIYKRQNQGTKCLRRLNGNATKTCKREGSIHFNPQIVLCKNYGPALAQFYFFGIFRGEKLSDETIPGPPVYFEWSAADPLEMIYMHSVARQVVYLEEEITFTCEYSRYYFSLGSWFGIYNSEKGMKYIPAVDIKPCDYDAQIVNQKKENCTTKDSWRGTYRAQLSTKFSQIGNHRVYCLGPVWNSTKWINTSVDFVVEQGSPPAVLSVKPEDGDDFVVGQQNKKLVCKFAGRPTPKVTWIGPTNESTFTTGQWNNYTSYIQFLEVGYFTKGEYTCLVSSYLGNDSEVYHVNPVSPGKLSTGAYAGIFIAVAVVVIGIAAVILRMFIIIKQQQNTLRLLTEAEVQEFIEGNPEFLQKVSNNYFDQPQSIEALPYDTSYEIKMENLKIEFSSILGSGEYGMVVKGTICTTGMPHLERIQDLSNDNELPENLPVAIKISKGNLDVDNFKALLSEIKVMAYLGPHDNTVSLIGASTENIRNRELYIVVEFCQNGSLEDFLKKNKESFKNPNDSGNEFPFRNKDLYKWAGEIADGLEYVHGKRIIHADLAIRNVLLTQDFTAKISDFGLSRQLKDSSSYTKTTKCALPWRNMAIESLRSLQFSVKSDVWSFGILLWEMFTLGDIPYPGLTYNVEFVNLLEQGLRLYKPPLASSRLYEYMLLCWSNLPDDRPSAGDVKPICCQADDAQLVSNYYVL